MSQCWTVNKWPKKAQHRLVLEPHRAESSSPQVLHQADSITTGSKGKSQTRDEFSPQQLECLRSHSSIAPFHFPVGNCRKRLPPVPCATGELPISLCSWECLLAGISPPQRGPWVPVLWETGAAGPLGAAGLLEEASCRCHDTSLICSASCRVPRHLPCKRMWGDECHRSSITQECWGWSPCLCSCCSAKHRLPQLLSRCDLKSCAHVIAIHQKVF